MIRKYIEDYLTFSRGERNAVIGLSAILLVLFALPKILPHDQINVDEKQLLSFSAEKVDVSEEHVSDSGSSVSTASLGNVRSKRIHFDPNTLDVAGWVSIGVKEKTAVTIQHYLEKGGRFRRASDLLKIYGLPAELAAELMDYVRIEDANGRSKEFNEEKSYKAEYTRAYKYRFDKQGSIANQGEGSRSTESDRNYASYKRLNNFPRLKHVDPFRYGYADSKYSGPGRPDEHNYSSRKIRSGTVDIATADTSALTTLPGIGSKLAARIVSFREKLGGFSSPEQLKEVFGIQDSVYQQLKPMLIVSTGHLSKININTAAEEILKAHPYIRWQLAKLIVSYRKEHGNFSAASDLENLQTLNKESLKKLLPYLEFQ